MAPQFYIFWAVSVPVTILVLIMWIVWSQRVEIAKFVAERRKVEEKKSDGIKEA